MRSSSRTRAPAWKFASQSIGSPQDGPWIVIEVSDTQGIGIPTDRLDAIFEIISAGGGRPVALLPRGSG